MCIVTGLKWDMPKDPKAFRSWRDRVHAMDSKSVSYFWPRTASSLTHREADLQPWQIREWKCDSGKEMDAVHCLGLPRWLGGKESACQCRRCRRLHFDPWVEKITLRKKWQPIPIFLPGKFHEQRSLVSYSPWDHKRVGRDWATESTYTHTHTHTQCFIMPRTHNYPYICEALGKNWSSILRNIKMTNMHLRRLKKWSHDHESLTWHASLMYTIELNINDLFLMYHNLWNA